MRKRPAASISSAPCALTLASGPTRTICSRWISTLVPGVTLRSRGSKTRALRINRSPEGTLLFVYETFVYFTETAPSDAWRNFMGLAAWERRSYFESEGVA